jgi:YegS/Rv2252/BmrU family lipid kinase
MAINKKILFVVNPISGVKGKKAALELLKTKLHPSIEYDVAETLRADHATELTREAIGNDYDAVIAVGGDGTVNEVGKALVNSNVALGVLPFGSGNGFARHRKIPIVIKDAIELINRFSTKRIDTATLNGEAFLTTAGLGFDAHVGWKFSERTSRGFLTYSQVAIQEFIGYKVEDYHLIIDGKELKTKAFVVSIANGGQYGNNAWISPEASMEDGKLNVCIIKPFPAHYTPDIVLKLFRKNLTASNYYQTIEAEKIEIVNAGKFHLDGEPRLTQGDLTIQVVPKSLKVIC